MIKQTNIDVSAKYSPDSLSLRFLSDGSLVVKKGSTTIQKTGSSATVTGGLIKLFKDDVVEDIGLVQKCFTEWMSELRSLYKGRIESVYHEESILITSIKYTRVVKTLVVASLPDNVVNSSSQPLITASDDTVSPSVSDPSESKDSMSGSGSSKVSVSLSPVTKMIHSRHYSTKVSVPLSLVPVKKISSDPWYKDHVCLSRVPSLIKLVRSPNGSFSFDGIESVNLLHSRHLKDILDSITGKILDIESINAKGYVNSTRLSDYPVLSGYLEAYVKSKKLAKMGADALEGLSAQERMKRIDSELTLREKRVLIIWFYSLFNLNMFYLILEVLDRLGVGLSNTRANELLESGVLTENERLRIADLIVDIKTCAWQLYGNLNPSIRESLRQRGVTVTENIYCGFDTEYKNVDMTENKILSAQWAVNSKIVLSLPYLMDYSLSGQNTLSGEIYPINSMWFNQEKIRFDSLQGEIRDYITRVRTIRFSRNDISLKAVTIGLIKKGIPYIIDNGKIHFSFTRTPVKTYFKSDDLVKLDLSKLVEIGLNLESEDMVSSRDGLYSLLKGLNLESKDKDLGSLLKDINVGSLADVPVSNFVNLVHPDGSSTEKIDPSIALTKPKKYKGSSSRTFKGGFTDDSISLTTRRNMYIIGHLTQADLSLLTDFEEIKSSLDIVNKCMVTLGKSEIVKHGHNIIFRDTLLLAPGGKQSLSAIGGMYGDHLRKITLDVYQYQNMDILMKEDPNLFKEYALRDSLISLVHASVLEDAHFKLNKLGIPLTLSSLGVSNLRNSWKTQGYKGYQISRDYLLGDSRKMPTPKGLFAVGDVGLFMNNYIGNYKGGRNESFMIGKDEKTVWYDYDLTAAYTTAMSMLGDPNYDLARRISPSEIKVMTDNELLYSYTTIEVENYRFPGSINYPSIPCYSDEVTTVYPLTGKAILTGSEYIAARNQGCNMDLRGGTLIPFRLKQPNIGNMSMDAMEDWRIIWERYKRQAFPTSDLWDEPLDKIFKDMPFIKVISDLQSERRKHDKGTISNLLYKEMGNSLYGSVTKGINHKVKFDIKTNKTVRMEASDISNPILASWVTAYVRSLLGELLQNVDDLGGKVVSVTTDGFITDKKDLESLILGIAPQSGDALKLSLLKEYRKTRKLLSGEAESLELKHEGIGIMSWTTRGQLSVDMKIKAITGLQTRDLDLAETWGLMSDSGLGKTVGFASTSLRSAIDLYKKGGHVTMDYRDRDFRILYNNNRIVVENSIEKGLLMTKPVQSVEESLTQRLFSRLTRSSLYQRNTSLKSINKYKSNLEIGIRAFLKDVLNERNGVQMSLFNGYKGLIDFVHKFVYDSGRTLNRALDSSYVSQVKFRSLNKIQKPRMVPRLPSIIQFFDYVKDSFKDYDVNKVLQKV